MCMRISDVVMDEEFIPLLTDLDNPPQDPMLRKKAMAHDIVSQIHGIEAAGRAQAGFERLTQNKEIPDEIPTVECEDLIQAVVAVRECSNSEARRLIVGGGIRINGEVVKQNEPLEGGSIVKVGKRGFIKVA